MTRLARRFVSSSPSCFRTTLRSAWSGGGTPSFSPVFRPVDGFHITLAFLGSRPRTELPAIVDAMREAAAEATAFELVPKRYRETRSVGMVVLDDPSGEATTLAERLHGRLEEIGVYEREARPWLPHATVLSDWKLHAV